MISSIIAWIVFGLVVGFIARALYPGKQHIGVANTIALGVAGSVIGGLIAWAFGHRPEEGPFAGAGWILSIVGALILVWAVPSVLARR